MDDKQRESKSAQNYITKKNEQQEKQKEGITGFGNSGGGGGFSFQAVSVDASEESLRRPRSQVYMDAINMIDMLSSTDKEIIEKLKEVVDEEVIEEFEGKSVEEILEEIRLSIQEELENREIPEENNLEGVISKCYISGCYVHSITPDGGICEHYTQHGSMPEKLKPGRDLYEKIKGNCNCIEVYTHCCRIIATDGSVETVQIDEI